MQTLTPIEQSERKTRALNKHIRRLGLRTAEEYRAWCNDHGFRRKLHKSRVARRRELTVFREQQIARAFSRRHFESAVWHPQSAQEPPSSLKRNVPAPFVRLMDIRDERRAELRGRLPRLHRPALLRLIRHLTAENSKLVTSEERTEYGLSYLECLATIAAYHRHWLRPVEEWRSSGFSLQCQYRTLVRLLFAQYDDVPCSMDVAWTIPNDALGNGLRSLYLHLGQGRSIRHRSLPISYTRKMAHHFLHSPDNLSPYQAIRWGQLRGLGVTEAHAVEVMQSRVARRFQHEEFWLTFFHWLAAHPMLAPDHVRPLIDYLHNQRFVPQPDIARPPQPNLSMRGRPLQTLIARMERWQRERDVDCEDWTGSWPATGFVEYASFKHHRSGRQKWGWTIHEILTAEGLEDEGRKMDHCVATYASLCEQRRSSIWSLERHRGSESQKLLTIEVSPADRRMVQARGKSNRNPTARELELLRQWAALADLRMGRLLT